MIIRSRSSRLALIVVVALVVLAGCSRDRKPQPVPTGASPSAPASPDRRALAERDALAAYRGMWLAMAKAGETPNPDDPEIRRYATGDALALVVGALVGYRERGLVTRGQPVITARATTVEPPDAPAEVGVLDCGDSTGWTTHNAKTGEQIKDDPRGRRRITATVKVVDATWKVTTFEVGDIGSC